MALNVAEEERQMREYETYYSQSQSEELEYYKRAVEMCIIVGYLNRDKFNQSLSFASGGKYGAKK